jgi:DNA repair protein REV1
MGSRLEKNSESVRKRIEKHTFDGEDGDEYKGSAFGGFTDYFRRKKIKLQNLDADIREQAGDKPPIFKGIVAIPSHPSTTCTPSSCNMVAGSCSTWTERPP